MGDGGSTFEPPFLFLERGGEQVKTEATVVVPKIYAVKRIPPEPHQRMFLPELHVGMRLWCHGNRRSSLGNYIGTFSETYEHGGMISPRSGSFNLLMEYVEPDPSWH